MREFIAITASNNKNKKLKKKFINKGYKMATEAYIAIENKDESVDYAHVIQDGFRLGKILLENYNDRDTVSNLIKHGEIFSLGTEIGSQVKGLTKDTLHKDFRLFGKHQTLFMYRDFVQTGLYENYYVYDALPTWDELCPKTFKSSFLFKDFNKGISWTYLYTKHNEWWVTPEEWGDDNKRKWMKLEDYVKEDELEELSLDYLGVSWEVSRGRKPKFTTFPELDSNLALKKEFFDWVAGLLDLRDIKEFLENFPYEELHYFKNAYDLKTFAFDFFKEKKISIFEDEEDKNDKLYFENYEGKILSFWGVEYCCSDMDCKLIGNEKNGFLLFDFKKYFGHKE